MPLPFGARHGPYDIVAQIGEGGMGQVYRAHDARLNRDVALTVLADAFADNADRLARFTREAQTLAALNHPHIAAIYGLEESNGVRALVMELVEGEDLSQRIARGAIPLDEALPIAKQIAEALEAAHEQGIIHRDLKPANIKVTPDGVVKVLDFGLAKLAQPQATAGRADLTASPTITSPAMMTGVGVILGTAAYMAPEQAKGREADKRSDIWALGSVLYEMLTGKRPFDGDDVSETLASVLAREPDWTALPATLAPAIHALLRRCLEKDRRRRIGDIAAVRFAIEEAGALGAAASASDAVVQPRIDAVVATALAEVRRRMRVRLALTGAISAIVVGASVGAGVWYATRPMPPRVVQFAIPTTPATALAINGNDRDLAITPDGSRLVYVGNRGTQLFVRALDALNPVAVYTGAPRGPFVSPDGQWIGFVDNNAVLKKVAVTGGPAVTLAMLVGFSLGATWAPDDTIIAASQDSTTGLQRVGAAGGSTTVLTRPDRAQGELDHVWPEMLPDGRSVLFTIAAVTGGLDAAQVAVLDLQTGTRTVLVRGGSHAHYSPSGHLVYAAAGTLRAVPFDLARLQTRGTPVPVIPEVVTTVTGGVDAVVAGDGTLAYVSGSVPGRQRTLVWVDRQGRETPTSAPPRGYVYPRLSPDGTRVAVYAQDQEQDIWTWDLGRTTLTRATFDPAQDTYPVWTPDSRRLIFTSDRAGGRNLFGEAADGTGAVERLSESPNGQSATAISPDGRRLIFTGVAAKTGEDVMELALDGTHRVTPLVQSPYIDRNGIISPDGRWLAYEATDSGRSEVYVRPFPEVNSGHWQVSTTGGARPLWAPSGQELFYVAPTGALMRVAVERGPSWAATSPTLLVKEGYFTIPGGNSGRTYDLSSDGQRFLMIKEGGGTDQTAAPPQLIVVQHFDEELKRLVPTK